MGQTQDGNIKRPTPKVINRINPFAGIVQPIGNGCGCRLVNQAQHIQPGQLRRILGRLALGIVKIGGHGDHGAIDVIVKSVLGTLPERRQNLGTDFDRAFFTGHGLQRDHAGLVDEAVRHLLAVANVVNAPPHQPLDRRNRVARVVNLGRERIRANLRPPALKVTHDAWQQYLSLVIGQAL